MKLNKILLLLITLLFLSCEKDDINDLCECEKTTYKYETVIVWVGGLPQTDTEKIILSQEKVSCQDEMYQQNVTDNIYFDIECF